MSSSLSLWCFFFSFCYGFLFGFLTYFHFLVVNKFNKLFQVLITFVFMLDIVLGYLLSLYVICSGIFHIYFLFFIFLGFFLFFYLRKNVKSNFISLKRNRK